MTATIPAAQQVDANGRTIDAYGPSVITTQILQNAANGTSNGADFDITGSATLQLLVTPAGSYTGTVTFNASPDGTNFDVIQGNQQGTSTLATSVVCSGNTLTIWTFQVSGLKTFRASIAGDSTSAHVVTVVAWASNVPIVSPLAATISSTVLGAGSALIGSAKISDGTTSSQKLAVDSAGNASTNLGKVGGTAVALGQTTMSASIPVTIASDQPNVNTSVTCYASAARTATPTAMADQTNIGAKGLRVVVDATVNAGGSGSITVTIQGKDSVSGKYYTILASAAIVTVTTNVYTVYPSITAVSNTIAQDALPTTWRVIVTANNANSVTYSVGASYLA